MSSEKKFKILIIEDDSLIGWTLANALGKAGYGSEIVECGEEAIRRVTEASYDLVITEISLPHMDGLALADRVKSISRNTPVILVSTREDLGAHEMGLGRSIDHFLEKPFNVRKMVSLVHDILAPTVRGHFTPNVSN